MWKCYNIFGVVIIFLQFIRCQLHIDKIIIIKYKISYKDLPQLKIKGIVKMWHFVIVIIFLQLLRRLCKMAWELNFAQPIPKVTYISLCIYCAKCILAIVLIQIYTSIVVVHFSFYYFFAFLNDEKREWMLVLLLSQSFRNC